MRGNRGNYGNFNEDGARDGGRDAPAFRSGYGSRPYGASSASSTAPRRGGPGSDRGKSYPDDPYLQGPPPAGIIIFLFLNFSYIFKTLRYYSYRILFIYKFEFLILQIHQVESDLYYPKEQHLVR